MIGSTRGKLLYKDSHAVNNITRWLLSSSSSWGTWPWSLNHHVLGIMGDRGWSHWVINCERFETEIVIKCPQAEGSEF